MLHQNIDYLDKDEGPQLYQAMGGISLHEQSHGELLWL